MTAEANKEAVLVTGGAGFIGSHTCEALIANGESVICLDNFNDYYPSGFKERNIQTLARSPLFHLVRGDITDGAMLSKLFEMRPIRAIIHLAAMAGVRYSIEAPLLYATNNINGTIALLETAHRYGIQRFVFGSSSSVYGENKKAPFCEEDLLEGQVSPYGASKRAGELFAHVYHKIYGIQVACLRFFTVYGPRGRPDMAPYKFVHRISQGQPIQLYGDGNSERDYTYISDIVAGIMAALEAPLGFEIINLGNSRPILLSRFIEIIEECLGKKAVIERQPLPPGDVPRTFAKIDKAKRFLGYEARVPIEEGLSYWVRWYQENIAQ